MIGSGAIAAEAAASFLRSRGLPARVVSTRHAGEARDAALAALVVPADDDEVLVFATRWPDGSDKVLGYLQGLSSIRTSENGRRVLSGGRAGGMTLDGLRRTIREVLATGGTP